MKSKLDKFKLYFEELPETRRRVRGSLARQTWVMEDLMYNIASLPGLGWGYLKALGRGVRKFAGKFRKRSKTTRKRLKRGVSITIHLKWLVLLSTIAVLGYSPGRTIYADPILNKVDKPPPQKPLADSLLEPQSELASIYVAPAVVYTAPKPIAPPVVPKAALTYANSYSYGFCTWYVASRLNVPNNLGNANTWAVRAAADGLTVSSLPRVGAVASTTAGSLGHVAVVIAVGAATVTVSEMNYNGFGIVDSRTTPVSDWLYIYP